MESVRNPRDRSVTSRGEIGVLPSGRLIRRAPVDRATRRKGTVSPRGLQLRIPEKVASLVPQLLAAVCFVVGIGIVLRDPGTIPVADTVTEPRSVSATAGKVMLSYGPLRVEPEPYVQPVRNTEPDTPVTTVHQEQPVQPRSPALSKRMLTQKVLQVIKRYAPRNRNPVVLAESIVQESLNQSYDPLFVAAVIKSESSFNELARSHKGAKGLMQLMPRTGSWLAQLAKMPKGELTDPGYNLALGIRYLKQLEQGYGGDRIFTLIAYNWGPGRVESATDGERRVPPEVMGYAIKILNDYRRWTSETT